MTGADQRALRAASDAYWAARREYETARAATDATYDRLHASPETIEYQIDWQVARREDAAAAGRLRRAEAEYRNARGYLADDG